MPDRSPSPSVYVERHRARFRAVWRDADGRKHREPFQTLEHAETFRQLCRLNPLDQVLAMTRGDSDGSDLLWPVAEAGGRPAPAGSVLPTTEHAHPGDSVMLGAYALAYVKQMTGVTERTRKDTLAMLNNHVLPYFTHAGDLPLTALRQKDRVERPGHRVGPDGEVLSISGWLLWLEKRHAFDNRHKCKKQLLSAKTVKNLHALLSAILQQAVLDEDGLLDRNPCQSSRLPEVQRDERPFLHHREFQALRAAVPAHFHCLLVFLVATGVRWGEAAGLAVKHLHLDPELGRPYVEVLVAWRRVSGGLFRLGRVKSRCSQRKITLSPLVVAMLRVQIEGKGPEDPVFTMVEGGRLHHANFSRYLKPALEEVGLSSRIGCHSFRHTHVAWLLSADKTVPMLAISRRLGHSSEAFTEKRYGHLLDSVDDNVLTAIDMALTPGGIPLTTAIAQTSLPADTILVVLPEAALAEPVPVPDAADMALPEFDDDDEDDDAA